jgi:outer membrane autotransporter protein
MGASGDEVGLSEKFSMFANIIGGDGEKDATDREDGFDLDAITFIVGADYRLNNYSVVGVSVGFEGYDADYTKNQRVSGGDMSVDTTTVSLYGLYSQEAFYMSAILGYGSSDFDTNRSVQYSSNNPNPNFNGADRQLTSSTESKQSNVSLTMGYQMLRESTTISPYVKLSYLDVEIDDFAETDSSGGGLGLKYNAQNVESFRGILGVQASWIVNQDYGVLSPYVIAEWHNEFKDDPDTITFQYIHDPRNNQISLVSDAVDSNYFNFTVGTSVVLANSFQMFADISTVVGFKDFSYTSLNLGIRKAF